MVARASRSPSTLTNAATPIVLRSELTELGPLASPDDVRAALAKPAGRGDARRRLPRDLPPAGGCL